MNPKVKVGDEIKIVFGNGNTLEGFVRETHEANNNAKTQTLHIEAFAGELAGKAVIWIDGQGRGQLTITHARTRPTTYP